MADKNFENVKINVEFEEPTDREALSSGEDIKSLFGKTKKYFTDMKLVAFSGSYNDLGDQPSIPTVTNDLTDELKSDYDEAVTNSHTHSNSAVLDRLSESDTGALLFDGNETKGKSAYEIACDNGFEGSEEEWVESLNGKDGKSITFITMEENNNVSVTFSDNTSKNIGQLDIDFQEDFLTSEGFGKIRFYDNKFQYYNELSTTWVDIQSTDNNSLVLNLAPQSMQKMNLIYDIDADAYKITFKEPKDTIVDGQMLVCVEGIKFVRKLGSEPENVDDGILVLDYKRRDFSIYNHTSFFDTGNSATTGENWYYKAFPYSTNGFISNSSANVANCTCRDYWLFGFKLDQNESDPASMITYIEDNVDFDSAYMDYTTDAFNYGDWSDAWFIRDLKPCMLNYDGTVAYELDKNDYSLKTDGTLSDIENDAFEGNAMVGIPKVYWKIVDNGDDTANIYFSNKKIQDDFVCWSHIDNNGNEIDYCYMPIYNGSDVSSRLRSLSCKTPIYNQTGTTEITYALANNHADDTIWYTEVFSDRMLINLLLLLIGKSTNTQTVFGNGYYTGGSSASNLLVTGTLNNKGLFYGTNGTGKGVKVFGMENWWGNQCRRIAGWINDKGTQKIKMTYGQSDGSTVDGYNTDGSGYIAIGCIPSGTNGGYINKMTVTENSLIPTTASGSATTYYPDGLWFNNSQVDYAFVGGSSNNGFPVGTLYSNLSAAVSHTRWTLGATVSCKPLATT